MSPVKGEREIETPGWLRPCEPISVEPGYEELVEGELADVKVTCHGDDKGGQVELIALTPDSKVGGRRSRFPKKDPILRMTEGGYAKFEVVHKKSGRKERFRFNHVPSRKITDRSKW